MFWAIKKLFALKAISRGRSKVFGAFILVLLGLSFTFNYSGYSSLSVLNYSKGLNLVHNSNETVPLIVPTYFSKKYGNKLLSTLLSATPFNKTQFRITSMAEPKIFPEKTLLAFDYSSVFNNFRQDKTHIYDSAMNIDGKTDRCEYLESELTYRVSSQKEVNTPVTEIAEVLIKALENHDEYIQEIGKYFLKKIRLQLKHKVADQFWFRLAGSSVWLKEYGVHLMVSRLVYSEHKIMNQPTFSVIYAQLYTDDWVEVTTSMLVPTNLGPSTNKNAIEVEDGAYTIMSFPAVLPVPFPFDDKRDYLGPEDPRIILVLNKRGYEEPMIVFNQYHQHWVSDDDNNSKVLGYRNMWFGWPWQFQKGMLNVNKEPSPEHNDKLFSRATELKINGERRDRMSKNWSPMISRLLREFDGYDKSILVSTRYPNLEVLKCDITMKEPNCVYMTIDDFRPDPSEVGALRGGTSMVNINNLIGQQTNIPVEKLIRKGREIWVGFARAHFRGCGCGNGFYRPNLVIVILDLIKGEDGKIRQVFSLSHVSAFMGLFVDIIPWRSEDPADLCRQLNILIPNGIGYWKIGDIKVNKLRSEWVVEDMLTLDFSVSDMSVGIVKISGILDSLIKMTPNSPFQQYEGDHEEPFLDEESENEEVLYPTQNFGASDDVIMCALEDSARFCRVYGDKHKFDKESGNLKGPKNEEKNKALENYEKALEEIEEQKTKRKGNQNLK